MDIAPIRVTFWVVNIKSVMSLKNYRLAVIGIQDVSITRYVL